VKPSSATTVAITRQESLRKEDIVTLTDGNHEVIMLDDLPRTKEGKLKAGPARSRYLVGDEHVYDADGVPEKTIWVGGVYYVDIPFHISIPTYSLRDAQILAGTLADETGRTHFVHELATFYLYPDVAYGRAPESVNPA
jgi:hypothetical protein